MGGQTATGELARSGEPRAQRRSDFIRPRSSSPGACDSENACWIRSRQGSLLSD